MTLTWTNQGWVDSRLCSTCYQPECPLSEGGSRPNPGVIPTRLAPGEREYRGYCEWVVHPEEAIFILHRGFALVDGQREAVWFIHNEAYVTQLRVFNSDPVYRLEEIAALPACGDFQETPAKTQVAVIREVNAEG